MCVCVVVVVVGESSSIQYLVINEKNTEFALGATK